jgi:hypothetical protein
MINLLKGKNNENANHEQQILNLFPSFASETRMLLLNKQCDIFPSTIRFVFLIKFCFCSDRWDVGTTCSLFPYLLVFLNVVVDSCPFLTGRIVVLTFKKSLIMTEIGIE